MEGAGYQSHKAYQKMQDAGIERKQADAIVSALSQFQGELATKTDLGHWSQRLNDKIDAVAKELRNEIKSLDSKIDGVAKDLHSKIGAVAKELRNEIKHLDNRIDTMGLKLLLSLGSFMMVLTGLIISAVKGWI